MTKHIPFEEVEMHGLVHCTYVRLHLPSGVQQIVERTFLSHDHFLKALERWNAAFPNKYRYFMLPFLPTGADICQYFGELSYLEKRDLTFWLSGIYIGWKCSNDPRLKDAKGNAEMVAALFREAEPPSRLPKSSNRINGVKALERLVRARTTEKTDS